MKAANAATAASTPPSASPASLPAAAHERGGVAQASAASVAALAAKPKSGLLRTTKPAGTNSSQTRRGGLPSTWRAVSQAISQGPAKRTGHSRYRFCGP